MADIVSKRSTLIIVSSNESLYTDLYSFSSIDSLPTDSERLIISNIVSGSLKLDEQLCEKVPQFGQLFASKFECKVFLSGDISKKFIQVFQKDSDDGLYNRIFVGYIDSCKLDKLDTDRAIVAYDYGYTKGQINIAPWWTAFWEGKETATLKQVRDSLLNYCEIEWENISLPNDDFQVTKTVDLTSCTMTAMLRMICELNYCFPHFLGSGILKFVQLDTSSQATDLTDKYEWSNSTFENFVTSVITGVQFYDSENELKYTKGTPDNAYPISQNIFLYDRSTEDLESIAQPLLTYLSGFHYTPSSVKMIVGDLNYHLGDLVHTEKGNFYILQNSLSGVQLYQQTLKAQGQEILYGGTPNFDYGETILNEKIARVKQTVEAFTVDYKDFKQKTQANFEVTSEKIETEVSKAMDSFEEGLEETISSKVTQTMDQISLSVENGEDSSEIKLKIGETVVSSETIKITGFVTFNDLETEGSTTINGSNITTGSIDASKIDVINLNADKITAGSISADRIKGGQLTIDTASGFTDSIVVKTSGTEFVKINGNTGITVGKSSTKTTINDNGLTIKYGTSDAVSITGNYSDGGIKVGGSSSYTKINNGQVNIVNNAYGSYGLSIESTYSSSNALQIKGPSGYYAISVSQGKTSLKELECTKFNCSNDTLTVNNKDCKLSEVYVLTKSSYSDIKFTKAKKYSLSSTSLWAVDSYSSPSMKSLSGGGYGFSSSPTWKKISLSESDASYYGLENASVSKKNVLAN